MVSSGTAASARITIDISGRTTVEPSSLIDWVRSSPCGNDIHVLTANTLVHMPHRSLQRTLQSLGCRITRILV